MNTPLFLSLKGEEVTHYEMWADVNGNGNKRYLSVNGKPLKNGDGQITGAVAVFHDLTERKLLEEENIRTKEQYRSLFDYNYDAVYSMDLEGNIISSNPASQQMTGYSDAEIKSLSFHSLIILEDLQKTIQHFQLAKGGAAQNYECLDFE